MLSFSLLNANQKIEDELNSVRKERWDFKAKMINNRKALLSEIEHIDNEQYLILQRMQKIEEEYFKLRNENNKKSDETDRIKAKIERIVRFSENKIKEEKSMLHTSFPYKLDSALQYLENLESKNTGIINSISLADYYIGKFTVNNSMSKEKRRFVTADDELIDAVFLRLGSSYQSYHNEGSTGILMPSGALTGNQNGYYWYENLSQSDRNRLSASIMEFDENQEINRVYLNPAWSPENKIRHISSSDSNFIAELIKRMKTGGPIMIPLIVILFIGLFIITERVVFMIKDSKRTEREMFCIIETLKNNDNDKLKLLASSLKESFLRNILENIACEKSCEKYSAEKVIEELLIEESSRLQKGFTTLAVLAAASPLLGLLGTVSGMINLFETITIAGTGDPKILAGGISEALVTTFTGLTIAIPLLFSHTLLKNAVNGILDNVEKHSLAFLNLLFRE